jgi:predicted transcriptional regulator
MELVASFRVESVIRAPLGLLWQSVRDRAAVSRKQFSSYFAGLDHGAAIHITAVAPLQMSLPLEHLRAIWHGFQPPQSFRYLTDADVARLGIFRRAA